MRLSKDLVSIHAYLCADGYVIKSPKTQKHTYFKIGLRNTNFILLKDFQDKFEREFKIKPHFIEGQRCSIGSREIYEKLTKELSKIWLRTYFDCEGWVFCKTHQNRHIGADCVNENGINQIILSLNNLNIKTIKKYNQKRHIYRILIYGKENLNKFYKEVGFLHPEKLKKLNDVIEDFIVYKWSFPENKEDYKKFIFNLLKKRAKIKKPYYIRVISKELNNLKKLKNGLNKLYKINSKINKNINGVGFIYYELYINKKEDVQKLIKMGVIKNLFKKK